MVVADTDMALYDAFLQAASQNAHPPCDPGDLASASHVPKIDIFKNCVFAIVLACQLNYDLWEEMSRTAGIGARLVMSRGQLGTQG